MKMAQWFLQPSYGQEYDTIGTHLKPVMVLQIVLKHRQFET